MTATVAERFAIGTGSLSVLNAGEGDIQISFNQGDPADTEKALKMLTDMQRRGYGIFVRLDDGSYARAESIDASRGVYIVTLPELENADETAALETEKPPRRRGRGRKKEMAVASTHAVGVARSAGG